MTKEKLEKALSLNANIKSLTSTLRKLEHLNNVHSANVISIYDEGDMFLFSHFFGEKKLMIVIFSFSIIFFA